MVFDVTYKKNLNLNFGKLKELSQIYTYSSGVNSKIFDDKGEILVDTHYKGQIEFCTLVWREGKDKENCRHACVHGGFQSAKKDDVYIFFCPYGMVIWSAAVKKNDRILYYVSAGPVLIHPGDDMMVERIINYNNRLKDHSKKVKKYLRKLRIIDRTEVYWLAKLLFMVVNGVFNDYLSKSDLEPEAKPGTWINAKLYHNEDEKIKKDSFDDGYYKNLFSREKELLGKISASDREGSERAVKDLIQDFSSIEVDIKLLKVKLIELIVILSRQATELGYDIEVVLEREYIYIQRVQECQDKERLYQCLKDIMDSFLTGYEFPAVINQKKESAISKAINYTENNYMSELTLERAAAEAGLSPSYFSRVFKKEMGCHFTEYVNRKRINLSKELLKRNIALSEVAYLAGFGDQSYFCKMFKKITGFSPGQYKNAIYRKG